MPAFHSYPRVFPTNVLPLLHWNYAAATARLRDTFQKLSLPLPLSLSFCARENYLFPSAACVHMHAPYRIRSRPRERFATFSHPSKDARDFIASISARHSAAGLTPPVAGFFSAWIHSHLSFSPSSFLSLSLSFSRSLCLCRPLRGRKAARAALLRERVLANLQASRL